MRILILFTKVYAIVPSHGSFVLFASAAAFTDSAERADASVSTVFKRDDIVVKVWTF